MPASKMVLPLQYYISTHTIIPSSKLFTMLPMSLQWKLSCSPSNVVLTKLLTFRMSNKSLLSLTLFTLPNKFLICHLIPIKFTPLPFLKNSGHSSIRMLIIALIFGTIIVKLIGSYILQLTKKPKKILSCLLSHINHLGTFAANKTVTLFLLCGGCPFKHQILKENNSLNFLIMILIILNHLQSKTALGYNSLVIPTLCVRELQELSLIMHLLVNIDLDFSLRRNFCVHVDYIPLNQENIFYMSVKDLTITGIQEETLFLTSFFSLYIIATPFSSEKKLLHCLMYNIFNLVFFFFLFSFFFFLFLLHMSLLFACK